MKVYFISGLAADGSVFKYIQLPASCEAVYLPWLTPLQDETLSTYALRMAEKIDASEPFALVGLSFGGMIAVEIANHLRPQFTLLISSIPIMQHLPGYYKFAGVLKLHKLVPISLIQHAAILKRIFTTETPEDKRMLKTMIRKSDAQFIKWALHAILSWQNTILPENLTHIHGSRDAILPRSYTRPTHVISNAGHLMILNRASEINAILKQLFSQYLQRDLVTS